MERIGSARLSTCTERAHTQNTIKNYIEANKTHTRTRTYTHSEKKEERLLFGMRLALASSFLLRFFFFTRRSARLTRRRRSVGDEKKGGNEFRLITGDAE